MQAISAIFSVLSSRLPVTEALSRLREATFIHQPLDLSKNEVRLLKIEPSSNAEAIHLKIQHFSFIECPPYQALSYTWGDPTSMRDIYINERRLKVRQNLWSFLETQRTSKDHVERDIWYWIDALCINQSDTPERNQQVQQMSQIYTRAWQVVIWLGDSADDSDFAIDLLVTHQWFSDSDDSDHDCEGTEHSVYGPRSKIAFNALLTRVYWRRMWIIQEIVLATTATVQCGHRTVNWETLDEFVAHVGPWFCGRSSTLDLARLRRHWRASGRLVSPTTKAIDGFSRLKNCLSLCTDFECEDVRDKIYAIQGIVSPEQRIVVDYSRTVFDIFEDVFPILAFGSQHVDARRQTFDFLARYLKLMPSSGNRPQELEDLYLRLVIGTAKDLSKET